MAWTGPINEPESERERELELERKRTLATDAIAKEREYQLGKFEPEYDAQNLYIDWAGLIEEFMSKSSAAAAAFRKRAETTEFRELARKHYAHHLIETAALILAALEAYQAEGLTLPLRHPCNASGDEFAPAQLTAIRSMLHNLPANATMMVVCPECSQQLDLMAGATAYPEHMVI